MQRAAFGVAWDEIVQCGVAESRRIHWSVFGAFWARCRVDRGVRYEDRTGRVAREETGYRSRRLSQRKEERCSSASLRAVIQSITVHDGHRNLARLHLTFCVFCHSLWPLPSTPHWQGDPGVCGDT